jgi:hypothetical protein
MYRLIYKSRSTVELNWDVVKDILHTSEVHNEANGITGILLATNTHYLQVLEGKFEDVNIAFMNIARDPRHDDIRLISFTIVDARLFAGWGMKGIGVFDFNKQIERQLMEKYGEEDGGIRFPLEEWMALAMIHDIKMMRDLPEWKR